MGTILTLLDRDAENIISALSIFGIVPTSSQKKTTRLSSFPPFSSATTRISRQSCCKIREIIKYLVLSSSGMTRNTAVFFLQKSSASMAVSKQSICSSSESRKAFSLDNAVERTDCMDCSAVFKAAPANHFALWVSGSFARSSWNWFFPFTLDGASKSCISLNTLMMCLFPSGQNSAMSRMAAVSTPSAASQKNAFCPQLELSVPPEEIMVFAVIFAYFSAFALALRFVWSARYSSMYLLTRWSILSPSLLVGLRRSMTAVWQPQYFFAMPAQLRYKSPFVSVVRKLIPQAQAYSMLGYRKCAVFPTPAAPIIRQCTSPVSTSAYSFPARSMLPSTSPCAAGRFSPLRHSSGSQGTCTQVSAISFFVANLAVPC